MDNAFRTAPYPALTNAQLAEAAEKTADAARRAVMLGEISRRARVAAGDWSVMTPGERLRVINKRNAAG